MSMIVQFNHRSLTNDDDDDDGDGDDNGMKKK